MEPRGVATDRNHLEVLDYDECLALLGSRSVGRVAFVAAGSPLILPVNYALDGVSVVVRSAVGSKLDAVERGRPVAFEIDDHDASSRSGWGVLVTGTAEPVEDDAERRRLDGLVDAWALDGRDDVRLIRIRADSVSGRRLPPRG